MSRLTVEIFVETCLKTLLKTIYPLSVTLQSSQEFVNCLGLDYFDVMGTILMPLLTTRKLTIALHDVHYTKLLAYSNPRHSVHTKQVREDNIIRAHPIFLKQNLVLREDSYRFRKPLLKQVLISPMYNMFFSYKYE